MKTNAKLPPVRLPPMPPEVTPMAPLGTVGHAAIPTSGGDGKAKAYRAACQQAVVLAHARAKCRELIDADLTGPLEDAARLARAMIEVGAAASRDLGDARETAFLLGHLSRRIREGDYIDF